MGDLVGLTTPAERDVRRPHARQRAHQAGGHRRLPPQAGNSPAFIRRIVSTGTLPGATQLTRTPNGARSTARLRVNWNRAPLAES